jgi:outer membrane lipoprotein-sorting protein
MKFKLLIFLILMLSFLSACKSVSKDIPEKNKEYDSSTMQEYDSSINQVIKLENEKLESEHKHEISRSETGIVVYNKGNIIVIYYRYNSKEQQSAYQKENNKYVLLPENENTSKKIDNAKEEYIENLGRK